MVEASHRDGPPSSDGFDDSSFSFDEAALQQIDQIASAANVVAAPAPLSPPPAPRAPPRPAAAAANRPPPPQVKAQARPPPPPPSDHYSDDGFFSDAEEGGGFSEEKLRELDDIFAAAQSNHQQPQRPNKPLLPSNTNNTNLARPPPPQVNAVAGPSRPQAQRTMHVGPSRYGVAPAPARQANLLGGFAAVPPPPGRAPQEGEELEDVVELPSSGMVRTEGKKWDRTAYAATGKRNRLKKKDDDGEAEEGEEGMEEEEEGGGGFEQFPAPFVDPLRPLPPLKHEYDPEAIKTWIYPINLPLRDYQLSIVSKCLYQNTLVALPTGLGKTFIAGVMMLNYSRWFPTGKIIFIAPTRPLVSQQAQAFPETCGFLNSKVTTLMGGVNPAKRQAEYPKKTVFFMTAQTLANDISKGLLDAKEIILLVVDEAHKATGNQAYCQVVSLIQARNHNFRILALTATPSGKVEGVQALIDSLHISHIEIRDEGSIDIVKYVHKKHTELILVKMTPNIIQLKDMMVELMMPMMKPLIQNGILRDNENDPSLIHCFRLHSLRNDLQRKKNFRWNSCLMQLEGFARALGYLLEHSVNMFSSSLTNALTKKDSATSKNKQINEILRTVEDMKTVGGFVAHAKMDRTKGLLLEHFAEREEGDGKGDLDPASTRVMVFCSFRECVNELVGCLNEEAPLLKAKAFVGQSKDTSGKAGLTQKAQIQIIKDFKEGKFNILVATQIGEEGLDIGAVDKIICYDAQKSSIRMLQRVGRTGRKRDGAITVLMGEGREEKSWDSAKESYESVQDLITRGAHLELYDDVPRLLPAHAKPVLVKKVVPIDTTPVEEDKPEKKVRKPRVSGAAAAKVERGTPIPKGATTGFVTARALKKKHIPTELEDDSDDAAIQAGPSFMARVNSAPSAGGSKAKGKGKGKARQMDSDDDDEEEEEEKSSRVPKRAKTTSAIPDKKRRVEEVEDDDGEDDEIKFQGFHRPQVPSRMRKDISSSPEGPPLRPAKKSAVVPPPKKPKVNPTPLFELPSSPPPSPPPNPPPKRAPQPPPISKARMAQPPPPPPPSKILQPPPPPKRIVAPAPPPPQPEAGPSVIRLPPEIAAKAGFSDIDMSWVLADDDEDWTNYSPPQSRAQPNPQPSTPAPPPANDVVMAPPSLPHHRLSSPNVSTGGSPSFPATQHPVRRGGIRPRLKAVVSSSPVAGPSSSNVPLARARYGGEASSTTTSILTRPFKAPIPRPFQNQTQNQNEPPRPKQKQRLKGPPPADVRRFMEVDAEDDRSSERGYSDDGSAVDDQETEEDRRFAGNFQPTQAPRGYNQAAAYVAGSQAVGGPVFARNARDEARADMFKRRAPRESESPMSRGSAAWDEEEDEDFVVGDDAPIEYDPSSEA